MRGCERAQASRSSSAPAYRHSQRRSTTIHAGSYGRSLAAPPLRPCRCCRADHLRPRTTGQRYGGGWLFGVATVAGMHEGDGGDRRPATDTANSNPLEIQVPLLSSIEPAPRGTPRERRCRTLLDAFPSASRHRFRRARCSIDPSGCAGPTSRNVTSITLLEVYVEKGDDIWPPLSTLRCPSHITRSRDILQWGRRDPRIL